MSHRNRKATTTTAALFLALIVVFGFSLEADAQSLKADARPGTADGGSALEGAASQTAAGQSICDDTRELGEFTLTFDDVVNDVVVGTSTWYYTLARSGAGEGPGEDPQPIHFTIGVCPELPGTALLGSSPPGATLEADPLSGVYGVRWDHVPGELPVQLSFTLSGFYDVASVQFTVGRGDDYDTSTICGVSCLETCVVQVNCPPDITVDCSEGTDPAVTGEATAVGSCPDLTITHTDEVTPGSCGGEYQITRTWMATDAYGNTDSCVQIIMVVDSLPPQIACPETLHVECASDVPPPSAAGVEAFDLCGEVTVTHVGDDAQGEGCEMVIRRTYRATDECGNFTECEQVILVEDTTAPVITCPQRMQVACIGDVPEPSPGTVEAEDNCGSVTVVHIGDEVEGETCPKTITRTYRATDECGNSSECEQIIVVTDSKAPEITSCPDTLWVECMTDVPDPDPGLVNVKDNCPDVTVRHVGDEHQGSCPTIISRLYEAVDACGNVAECVHTIVVDDVTAPVVTCPGRIEVQCAGDVPEADPEALEVRDNCGEVTVEHLGDVSDGGSCPETITRTYRAVDACGNATECEQLIVVNDTTPPEITCPLDLTFECDAVGDYGQATATDNCDTAPEVDYVDVVIPGSCPQEQVIERTWTATDACGNSASCMQIITIEDTTPPAIACPGETLRVLCGEPLPEPDPGSVDAEDNCGQVTVEHVGDVPINDPVQVARNPSHALLNGEGGQLVARTYRATDECGNSSECVQMILLEEDNTPPVIECEGFETTVECDQGIPVLPPPVVWDNCDPDPDVTVDRIVHEGACPNERTIEYVVTATDAAGNTATATCGIVEVVDTTPPMVLCPDTMWVDCGGEIPQPVSGEIYAEDNCGQATVAHVGDESGGNIPVGEVHRTYRATDECGNSSDCVQIIVLEEDTEPPVIACQPVVIEAECDGEFTEPPVPDVWDECDPNPQVDVIVDEITGDCPHDYEITKTVVATDAAGNRASCEYFRVKVQDTTPPTVTCPPEQTYECDEDWSFPSNDLAGFVGAGGAAEDNCSTELTAGYTMSEPVGACPKVWTLTWTVEDECGNPSETCDQLIKESDTTDPEIATCPTDSEFDGPDLVIYPDNSWTGFVNSGGWADDNCDTELEAGYTVGDPQGECPTTVVLTWTVMDDCENTATCDQTITINCPVECGRWTGHGTLGPGATVPEGARVTHSFHFGCGPRKPSNLQANWDGNKFHMTELLSVYCVMNPDLPPPGTPGAPMNEVFGSGTGRYNKDGGYTVDFHFTDVGEPGLNDYGSITITAPDGEVILQIEGTLTFGNHQAHPYKCDEGTEAGGTGDFRLDVGAGDAGRIGQPDIGSDFDEDGTGGDLSRVPSHFTVLPGVPNPFKNTVKIGYGIPVAGLVKIEVYDVAGRRLATLLDEEQTPGFHSVIWDGRTVQGERVAPGVYFTRVRYNGESEVKKMILME